MVDTASDTRVGMLDGDVIPDVMLREPESRRSAGSSDLLLDLEGVLRSENVCNVSTTSPVEMLQRPLTLKYQSRHRSVVKLPLVL